MNDWQVLGLEPTDDKEEIKNAYRRMLPNFHPEEDPEGFQRLRDAYENLMRQEQPAAEEEDNTPTGLWVKKAVALYEDFGKRIDPANWEELLRDEICFGLDTAQEAGEKLLVYLMDHFYLPHEVLQVLEQHFSWEEKREQLCNQFPTDFVDYIISNAKYEDSFRYPLFQVEEGKNYDAFMSNYFRMLNLIEADRYDEVKEPLETLLGLGIDHPDFTIIQVRYALIEDDYDTAGPLCEKLLAERPDDAATWYCVGRYYLAVEKVDQAKDYFSRLIEQNDHHVGALVGMAECAKVQEEPLTALEYYERAFKVVPYDNYINGSIYDVNKELAEIYRKQGESNPDDKEIKLKCVKAYARTYQFDQAREIAQQFTPDSEQEEEYVKIMAQICSGTEDYEQAVAHLRRQLELTEDKGAVYAEIGLAFLNMERYEEALAEYEKGLALDPNSVKLLYRKAAALNKLSRYEEAVEICDQSLAIEPLPNAHHFKAEALFFMGEYQASLDSCEEAIRTVPYLDTYLIEIKIYYNVEHYDHVLDIISRLEDMNLVNREVMLYKLQTLRQTEKWEEAKQAAKEMLEKDPDDAEIYYQMGLIAWDEKDYDEALSCAKKSYDLDPAKAYTVYLMGDIYLRMRNDAEAAKVYEELENRGEADDYAFCRLAEICQRKDDNNGAIEYYKKAIKDNPENKYVHSDLADIYSNMGDYQNALAEIDLQIKVAPAAYYYCQRGYLYMEINHTDKAIADLKQALAINPESSVAYNLLGCIHKDYAELDEAIECFQKARTGDDPYRAVYYNLGKALQRKRRYEEAVACYTEAMEKFPEDQEYYTERAEVYSDWKHYDEAIEDWQKYGDITGNLIYVSIEIGECYASMKQFEQAIRCFEKAMAVDKKDPRAYRALGKFYLSDQEDGKKAVKFLEKALKYTSGQDEALLSYLGEAYEMLGKTRQAEKYYHMALDGYLAALEKEPGFAHLLENIGDAYLHLGDYDKARKYLKQAIERGPYCRYCSVFGCHEAHDDLGELYEKLGEYDKALEEYKTALSEFDDDKYREAIERLEKKCAQMKN